MSTTLRQVGRWTSVALTVLYGSYDRTPTEASSDLLQQTVSFTVEADAFADGGQGCWQGPFECGGAYFDETPGNWGDAQVRLGTDVDLWYDDGGIVIGGLDGLEWLTFPVTVPQSGRYRVTFRTASPADRPSGSGVVNVGVYGVEGSWLGNQIVPVTGGAGEWHQYVTWQAPTTVYLPAGAQTLTMWAAGGYYNVHAITFTLDDTPEPPPDAIIPGQLNPMVLSGYVRDEAGTPLRADIWLYYCGTVCNQHFIVTTDEAGHYEVAFDAVPDRYYPFNLLGVAFVSAAGNAYDARFVKVATQHANYDFVLRTQEWIPASGSANVTVRGDDPLCWNDYYDPTFGSTVVCHTVGVVAPSDGTLRIEVIRTEPVEASSGLVIQSALWEVCCDVGVYYVPVIAGERVSIDPYVNLGETQSFTIFTSMSSGPE